MRVFRWFSFDAAHSLPFVPEGHKCGRVHGHTYRVRVIVDGPVGADGFVVDYSIVSRTFSLAVMAPLDHRNLNDTIHNPTAERIAEWIAFAFQREMASMRECWPEGVRLATVEVFETEDSGCVYEVLA